jgi:hypothetical protein
MDDAPPSMSFRYQESIRQAHFWSLFIFKSNFPFTQQKLEMDLRRINSQIKKDDIDYGDFHPPSIIDYYNLFPKWVREHPTMQMFVRGIEYYNPLIPFKFKQHMLNQAAQLVFPFDSKLTELYSYGCNVRQTPITLENVNELINFDYDENRIVILPDDYYTDEEDLEGTIITAAMVRVWEKEDEDERKAKKRDEGRAKRAAEEAKAAGKAPPKVDKAAEEKKKEEEEILLMEEENKRLEEEKLAEEERIKQEERERKRKIKLEVAEKQPRQRSIMDLDPPDDGVFEFGDKVETKKKEEKTKKKKTGGDDEELEFEGMKTEHKTVQSQEVDQSKKIEHEKRKEKKEKQIRHGKKYFEDKTEEIRAEIIEKNFAFIKAEQNMSTNDKILKIKQDYSKNEELAMHIYVALMKSESFAPDTKEFIKSTFKFEQPVEEIQKQLKRRDDERVKEYNLMMDLLEVTSTQLDAVNKAAIEDLYSQSLKDHDNQLQSTEDVGLKDVYVRPLPPIDQAQRPESWQVPVDYYINDDGYWDDYINDKRKKIDIKLYHEKPFIWFKDRIKRVSDD